MGDVALVHDNCKRNQWKLTVIKELFPGQDGLTRSVMIKTITGIALNRVRTSSEIQKSRVFQGCFTVFSKAFPGFLKAQNENNIHNEL